MMDREQFARLLADGYNRIPLARTILADVETPLSAYRKLAAGPFSFLFESVQGGEKWGRYSIIGLPASQCYSISGNTVSVIRRGEIEEQFEVEDPLAFVEKLHSDFAVAPVDGLPVFHGGLVGYFGYDVVRYVEPKLRDSTPEKSLNTPDILLMLSDEVLVFDNLAGTLTLIITVEAEGLSAYDTAIARLDALEAKLPLSGPPLESISLQANDVSAIEARAQYATSQEEFESWVRQIKEYILAGDVMQVVPSQRMSIDFAAQPIALYRALRNLNPSPYMYFLDMGDFQIVGSSPEILVRAEQGHVTVRPIAGTRRRGKTPEEDEALATELRNDPKEVAEHLMLIDLGRNDVGRVAEPGSVKLTENMVIERYSHVMHIVSNVTGTARKGLSAIDALRAALPAGTLSGAPKVRAMEIIDSVEPVKRGVYGGAVGYLSWAGDMDTAIAIRTAIVKDGYVHVQAGAGVVADSVPHLEWEETVNKARAILRAIAMVEAK
jgi:anthranilate synthase component 1